MLCLLDANVDIDVSSAVSITVDKKNQ